MATISLPGRLTSWTGVQRKVWEDPRVVRAAILCATLIVLAFVGALTFLAYSGKGTEALVVAVIAPVIGLLVSMRDKIGKIERHTNGTTTRLLDAALPTPEKNDGQLDNR